ncbi:hypothetical protein CYY_008985 [Polysphondylium violaceum]|uniref:Diphthamide biosynthesis protein 4 n=1 Tax=Polysphondylium violaceum TaxID=133409 RepID=A0A8J4PM90_9MYCE|nr:hypothetical protein CYY_008985 [Polysphondylium violaceum]
MESTTTTTTSTSTTTNTTASETTVSLNYYEILNVQQNADYKEIKKSFSALILQYHPDKNNSNSNSSGSTLDDKDKNKYLEIQKAWEVLRDDDKRKQYDSELLEQGRQKYSVSDEVDIDDMELVMDEEDGCDYYSYPCRCGSKYTITEDDLLDNLDIAWCTGCSLTIRVLYNLVQDEDDEYDQGEYHQIGDDNDDDDDYGNDDNEEDQD